MINDRDKDPGYQFVDELVSWIKFNDRVLFEAQTNTNPILERFNFVGIADNNLDEFIKTKFRSGQSLKSLIVEQTKKIEECYMSLVIELKDKYGITIINHDEISGPAIKTLEKYFMENLYPILQPLIISDELPIPKLSDGGTFIISTIKDDDKYVYCIVQLPENKLIKVPGKDIKDTYISTSDIIMHFVYKLYQGVIIEENKMIRVMRKIDNLQITPGSNYLKDVKDQLFNRDSAEIIMTDTMSNINGLEKILKSSKKRKRSYVAGLKYLMNIKDTIKYTKDMVYPKAKPRVPAAFADKDKSIFDILSERSVLVHFPYESFNDSTVRFVEEASNDPNVLCIKCTLYRVAKNSKLEKALINAAKSGKDVTVLLELKAKLDEYNNLRLTEKLQQAGCHIIFGPINMKTHAKTILVVRKEHDRLAMYCNISTGNYNEKTAKIYEDLSLFCKHRKKFKIGTDICQLYQFLGGMSKLTDTSEMIIAPLNFRSEISKQIDLCVTEVENGGHASVFIKTNGLTDHKIAEKIIEASKVGVYFYLVVRGMNIIDNAEYGNICIKSIVGRYLEHSRIYEFTCGNNITTFIGSCDLMTRNLDHRIETLVPIHDKVIKKDIHDIANLYVGDEYNSHILENHEYKTPSNRTTNDFSVQKFFIDQYENIEKSIL